MRKVTAVLTAFLLVLSLAACAVGGEPAVNDGNTEPPQSSPSDVHSSENSAVSDETVVPSEPEDESAAQDETSDDASAAPEPDDEDEPEGSNILVAYFSATNNTEDIAQKLAAGLGADLYEIIPAEPYTSEDLEYGNSQSRTSLEMDDPDARPAISGSVEDIGRYDVVFIGYPIWWGEAPRIMSTFIESYDFSGKTLVAFCTSGSSGFGDSDSALRASAGGAVWLDGRRFPAGASSDEVMEWANGLAVE